MKQLTIQESQDRLLEMGKAIHAVLTKHNISYMITFGTLLGAVRHGGFIPWDDDFDIFLFDSEYESAIKFLKQELPTEMFVEDSDSEPLYFHSWAHVKDKRTIAFCEQFPQDNIYSHKGLSIDLYRAFPMLESEVNLFRLEENLKYQTRKKKIGLISDKEFDIISAKINEEISEEKNKNAFSDREVLGMVMNERLIYSDFVFPLKLYKFGNTEFYGPKDYHQVLTGFYGDYMKLPDEKHRIGHYSKVEEVDSYD